MDLILGQTSRTVYVLRDSPEASPENLVRRRAWLSAEDETAAGAR